MVLHVPANLFRENAKAKAEGIAEPDRISSILPDLRLEEKEYAKMPTILYPVGAWMGRANSTFLNHASACQYGWGFGHPCNLVLRGDCGVRGSQEPLVVGDVHTAAEREYAQMVSMPPCHVYTHRQGSVFILSLIHISEPTRPY